MALVSVVVPFYNAERYLGQAIASLLAQEGAPDMEIVAVDDGSTDASRAVLESFSSPMIKLCTHAERLGVACARNTGIAAASGRFIAFLDADDVAYPHRLAVQVAYLQQHPQCALVGAWIDLIDEQGRICADNWVYAREENSQLQAALLFHNRFALSSVMVRAEYARLGFDASFTLAEDYDLWVRIAARAPVAIVPLRLVQYRRHAHSLIQTRPQEMEANVRRIVGGQLAVLGIAATQTDIAFHRRLAKLQYTQAPDELPRIGTWLTSLYKANARSQLYAEPFLGRYLALLWLRACAHHAKRGWFALRHLLASPFVPWRHGHWLLWGKTLLRCLIYTKT